MVVQPQQSSEASAEPTPGFSASERLLHNRISELEAELKEREQELILREEQIRQLTGGFDFETALCMKKASEKQD